MCSSDLATVGFVPDAEILEFLKGAVPCGQDFRHVAPVHEDERECPIDAVRGHVAKSRMQEILAAGLAAFQEFKNLCVWNKTNGGMGSLYRSKHELVFVFKTGTAPHINNVELGRHGRYRTNVWDYAGANSFGRNRKFDLETHPTVEPVAMLADAIKDCSHRSGIVLDPFGGSGTTLIAAERTGRRARLIELDLYYVDAAVNRWARQTAGLPQRVSSVNGASGSDQQEVGAGSETQAGPASLELPPVWLSDWGVVP